MGVGPRGKQPDHVLLKEDRVPDASWSSGFEPDTLPPHCGSELSSAPLEVPCSVPFPWLPGLPLPGASFPGFCRAVAQTLF